MKLALVEPLRSLFKDEVRKVGRELGIPHEMIVPASLSRARAWASGFWEKLQKKRYGYCRKQMLSI